MLAQRLIYEVPQKFDGKELAEDANGREQRELPAMGRATGQPGGLLAGAANWQPGVNPITNPRQERGWKLLQSFQIVGDRFQLIVV